MARKDGSCDLTAREVDGFFSDPAWAAQFPPVLTVDQAADRAQIPKQTVYAWSSPRAARGVQPAGRPAPPDPPQQVHPEALQRGIHGN